MAAFFLAHPEVKHGDICIAFTPDEEVGNGVEYFDVPGFGADFAYTVDGGSVGEIEYENFNAANLRVEVQGYGIHPGSAKGKMKNAIRMAMEFEQMLTVFDNPEYTDGYEGFHSSWRYRRRFRFIQQCITLYVIMTLESLTRS